MASRRGHNEGSIYQRESDSKWVASVNLGYGTDGKRKRKVIYGETRKEVAEKLKVVLRDQQQGLPIVVGRQTIKQFLERWLEDVVKPSVRTRTYDSYAQLVRLYIVPALGRKQLAELTPQDLQEFLNNLSKQPVVRTGKRMSPRTINYCRAVLRRALGQAVKWDQVVRNVATLVEPARQERAEIQPLTPEQARSFLAAVRGDRLEALYSVALAVGLRQGEALGLRWQDIDLEAGTLTVRYALQRLGGKLQLVEPKTKKSRRTIPLPKTAILALRTHRVRQLEERLLAGTRWQESGYVFPSTIGTPLDPRNAYRAFQEALKAAGLPHVRFHDLRHTCATLLLVQGVPARVVMEILGHSQISLTMDTYSHVSQSLQREAADRMDDLLDSGT